MHNYVTCRTLYVMLRRRTWCRSCDVVYILFLADQNFQRSTIGCLSNSCMGIVTCILRRLVEDWLLLCRQTRCPMMTFISLICSTGVILLCCSWSIMTNQGFLWWWY